jgi:hypothetical protein
MRSYPKTVTEYEAEVAAAAATFTASQFLGAGRFDTREFPTREAAVAAGREMKAANGRPVLIYGIAPGNRSVLLETI